MKSRKNVKKQKRGGAKRSSSSSQQREDSDNRVDYLAPDEPAEGRRDSDISNVNRRRDT